MQDLLGNSLVWVGRAICTTPPTDVASNVQGRPRVDEHPAVLTVICAWCGKLIRAGEDAQAPVSHGICEPCARREEAADVVFEALRAQERRDAE